MDTVVVVVSFETTEVTLAKRVNVLNSPNRLELTLITFS